MRELPEAKPADTEFTEKSARPAAELAPVVLPALELGLALIFDAFCCCAHNFLLCRRPEGDAESLQKCTGLVVIDRRGHDGNVHTLEFFNLGVVDLRKNELVPHP